MNYYPLNLLIGFCLPMSLLVHLMYHYSNTLILYIQVFFSNSFLFGSIAVFRHLFLSILAGKKSYAKTWSSPLNTLFTTSAAAPISCACLPK